MGREQPHNEGAEEASSFPERIFLTQQEAAQLVRLSVRTLERLRASGMQGPKFVKLGRRVVYRLADLTAWADARTFKSTSEYPE